MNHVGVTEQHACIGCLSVSTSLKPSEHGRLWGSPTQVRLGPPPSTSLCVVSLGAELRGGGKGAVTESSRCHPSSLSSAAPQLLLASSLGPSLTLLRTATQVCVAVSSSLLCSLPDFSLQSLVLREVYLEDSFSAVRTPLLPGHAFPGLALRRPEPREHNCALPPLKSPTGCLSPHLASCLPQTQAGGQDSRVSRKDCCILLQKLTQLLMLMSSFSYSGHDFRGA